MKSSTAPLTTIATPTAHKPTAKTHTITSTTIKVHLAITATSTMTTKTPTSRHKDYINFHDDNNRTQHSNIYPKIGGFKMVVPTPETMMTAWMKKMMYTAMPTTIAVMMTRLITITSLPTARLNSIKTNKRSEESKKRE